MNRNVTKTVTHHILPCLGLLIVEAVSCVLAVYGIVTLLGYDVPSYIPCRAWNLTSPVRLPYAVPLSEIGLARPPQSWQYLTEEQAALLR